MNHSKGTAPITGASRGIGAVYAGRLAKRGYDLIVVARGQAPLEALAARLANETGRPVTPLPIDLNDKADLAKVETTLPGLDKEVSTPILCAYTRMAGHKERPGHVDMIKR
jgi:short-subunit dehydrogenase